MREFAEKAGITANTLNENGADAKQSTMDALQRALEAAGIEFTKPGVRLAKSAAQHQAHPAGTSKRAAKAARSSTRSIKALMPL
jgi:hypothetical protein